MATAWRNVRTLLAAHGSWLGPCALLLALTLPFLDMVPMWDAWHYYDACLAKAMLSPADLLSYTCEDHPSIAYMALMAVSQWLAPGQAALLNGFSIALALAGVLGFRSLAARTLPDAGPVEVGLVTALYAVSPVVVANVFHFGPDLGLLVFGVLFADAVVAGRDRRAALFGTAFLFTKEPALALYPVIVAVVVTCTTLRSNLPLRDKAREVARRSPLAVPGAVFAAYWLVKTQVLHQPGWHLAAHARLGLPALLRLAPLDPEVKGGAAVMFVLNFNWLFAGLTLLLALRLLARLALNLGPGPAPLSTGAKLAMALVPACALAFTRVVFYLNPRYFLFLQPFLLLAAAAGLRAFLPRPAWRLGALAAALALLLPANLRTIDPVSAKVFGTFAFGERRLLDMTSVIGECCGRGRDQLVYNLEYTSLHYLLNAAMRDIAPDVPLVVADGVGFHLLPRVDNSTGERTLDRAHGHTPPGAAVSQMLQWPLKPREIAFLDVPFGAPNDALVRLEAQYTVSARRHYEHLGHGLTVVMMARKGR